MKKSFLILGVFGAFLSTNGYAVQSQDMIVIFTCPIGCQLSLQTYNSTGDQVARCYCDDGSTIDPTIKIEDTSPSPATIQQVMNQSEINQAAIKNVKKQNKVSARAAAISPKMVKKIVYEEIISDDVE